MLTATLLGYLLMAAGPLPVALMPDIPRVHRPSEPINNRHARRKAAKLG
jgi:hypothetical protein